MTILVFGSRSASTLPSRQTSPPFVGGIGAFYSRQNQTSDDFVLGGRRMSPVAVGLSLFATIVSTLSYLGNPGEMITHGPIRLLTC